MFIDSKDANAFHARSSHFTYVFRDAITVNKNEGVLISLLQASIPYSFYNIRPGVNAKEVDGVPINQIPFAKGPDSYLASLGYGEVVAQEPAPEPKKKIVVPPTPKQSVAEKLKKEVENTSPRDIPDVEQEAVLRKKKGKPDVGSDESSTDRHSSDEEEDERSEEDNGSVLSDSEEEDERQIKKLMDELA
jgi:hypothetical protein